MDTELKGTNALITGGSSGIGLGIATALAREGVNLAIASRHPDEEALRALQTHGVRVRAIPADVSKEDEVRRMVASAVEAFGALHAYVNNAAWSWHEPVTKLTARGLENTMRTNLFACFWACREVARHMIARRSGAICIVGSTAEFTPQGGEASYRASKLGLRGYMESLAVELAPFGVRVNMVVPGHFVTRLTAGVPADTLARLVEEIPLGRTGDPEEVGAMTAVLLSNRLTPYTTGAAVTVDGGLHLRPLKMLSREELASLNT